MKAVIDALNVTYSEKESEGFIKLNLVSLVLTGGEILRPACGYRGDRGAATGLIVHRFRRLDCDAVASSALSGDLGLAVLYRFGPSRESLVGSGSCWQCFCCRSWLAGSALLSWYLANFAHYDATYGSLGAAIGMMIWMWMSSIVILLGAELNSEVEHQTARDSTTGHQRPSANVDWQSGHGRSIVLTKARATPPNPQPGARRTSWHLGAQGGTEDA